MGRLVPPPRDKTKREGKEATGGGRRRQFLSGPQKEGEKKTFPPARFLITSSPLRGSTPSILPSHTQSRRGKKNKPEISPVMHELATYMSRAIKRPLPKPVAEKTKHHVLDTIAAMVSGSRLLPGEKAISFIKAQGGTPEATVIGSRVVTTAQNAALANGMLAHADETDDSHAPSLTHPGCGIVPAALAMAEREQATARVPARGRAGLRRRLPHDHGAARLRFPRSRPLDPQLRPDVRRGRRRGIARRPQIRPGAPPAVVYRAAGVRASRAGCATPSTSRKRSTSAACRRATASRPPPWSRTASPRSRTCSRASAISSSRTTSRAASASRLSPKRLIQELGTTFEIMNTNIKRWSVGSPIQAPLDSRCST